MKKQSRFSHRLAIYLWLRFLIPLICCLACFSLLFMVLDAFDVLQNFIQNDASVMLMLEYFIYTQPQRLTLVVHIAFLLAAMYTFAGLSRHNEIVAVRASGISLVRTCVYIWLTALCFGFGLKYVLDDIKPKSVLIAEEINEKIEHPERYLNKKALSLVYENKKTNREWKFGQFTLGGEMKYVTVKQFREDGTKEWEILEAETAVYAGEQTGWLFENGRICFYDKEDLPISADKEFTSRRFSDLKQPPSKMMTSLRPSENLTTNEIYQLLENSEYLPASTKASCYSEINFRRFFPFSCLIAILFGIPLSINTGRGGMFANLGTALLSVMSFYIVFVGLLALSRRDLISPLMAGLIPTLGYLVVGGFIMYKKR